MIQTLFKNLLSVLWRRFILALHVHSYCRTTETESEQRFLKSLWDLWINVSTVTDSEAPPSFCNATLKSTNHTSLFRSEYFQIVSLNLDAGFITRHSHSVVALWRMQWSLHSRPNPAHYGKADCRRNTCTKQQYIVTSNINDFKIYTCNFTAIVNILRHLCNSIIFCWHHPH